MWATTTQTIESISRRLEGFAPLMAHGGSMQTAARFWNGQSPRPRLSATERNKGCVLLQFPGSAR